MTATFDFTIGANNWSGNVDSASTSGEYWFNNQNGSTVNGFIMQLAANDDLVMFHDPPVNDGPHTIKSVFTIPDAGDVNQTFTVDSLNWGNSVGDPTEATIKGYSGGVGGSLVWTLSGVANIGSLVTAASSGTFDDPIDTMVWKAPGNPAGVFGSKLDNVSVTIIAP